jgi:PKD repeat protein
MRANDTIQFFIKEGSTWIEYTEGILNIDITRGIDQYIGPWQQSDVGQITLTSRNENLDPYVNAQVRMNKEIRIVADNTPIFTGRISNIDVNYQPKGKDPIVTINGIDFLGTMKKHILSDTFIKTRPQSWTGIALLQDLGNTPKEIEGYYNPIRLSYGGYFAGAGSIPSGTSCYDALVARLSQQLGFIYANKNNEVIYYGHQDFFPAGGAPYEQASVIDFRSDGTGTSYKAINLNDGFERIVNQLSFSDGGGEWVSPSYTNFTSWAQTSSTYKNTPSVNLWGSTLLTLPVTSSFNTVPPTNQQYSDFANAIFIESANPQREVQEITWDALKNVSVAKNMEIFNNIDIYHEVDSLVIDRKYSVVGIKHRITESDWDMTLVLRNFYYVETSMPDPVVLVAEDATGDTNHYFNFSIDFPADQIQSVLWNFGDNQTSTSLTPSHKYSSVGTKNVTVKVKNLFNWEKTSDPLQVTVVGAAPTNTWTFAQSPTSWNTVEFMFTGYGANGYLWDFGDGTTSTLPNPVHSFPSTGTRNVSLTCANTFGTNTVTHPVTVTEPVNPPDETGTFAIRYLKIAQPSITLGYPLGNSNGVIQQLKYLKAKTSNGVNLALNKPAISVNNVKGALSDNVYLGLINTACYGTNNFQKYQDWNWTLQPTRLTGDATNNAYVGINPQIDYDTGDCGKTQWDLVIDLGANYNTIDQIQLTGSWSGPSITKAVLSVYGSTDNVTYTKIGEFNVNGLASATSQQITMTPTGAMPPNL